MHRWIVLAFDMTTTVPTGCDNNENAPVQGGILRSPGFARLLAVDLVNPLGDAMATTALILHVQQRGGSGTAIAGILVAEAVPPLLSPLTGTIADRVRDPRRLLAVGMVLQSIVVLALAATLAGDDSTPLAVITVLVFLRAAIATAELPALGAAVPAVVDDANLERANGLLVGAREVGVVIGPPIAGVIVATSTASVALVIDAITFLAVTPVVLTLPALAADRLPTTTKWMEDVRAGLTFVWRTPAVRAIALGFWLLVFASAADDLIVVFLAVDVHDAGPIGAGILLAAASAGVIVGMTTVTGASRRATNTALVLIGFAGASTGNLLTAVAPTLVAAVAAQVLRGVFIPIADVAVRSHLQRTAPPAMLGRALANMYGGVSAAAAFGYVVGGPLLDATSPRVAMAWVGLGGYTATGVTLVLLRRARR